METEKKTGYLSQLFEQKSESNWFLKINFNMLIILLLAWGCWKGDWPRIS